MYENQFNEFSKFIVSIACSAETYKVIFQSGLDYGAVVRVRM